MRDIVMILFFVTAIICRAGNVTFSSADEKQATVERCSVRLRFACTNLLQNMPLPDGHAETADTLRSALYADTVSLPLFDQIFGRLSLEPYYLLTNSSALNLKEARAAINSCHKSSRFHDMFYLMCAKAVADDCMSGDDYDTAELYYLRTLIALRTMNNTEPSDLRESCYQGLSAVCFWRKDIDKAVEWGEKSLSDIRHIYGPGSAKYDESVAALSGLAPFMTDKDKAADFCDRYISAYEESGTSGHDEPYVVLLRCRADLASESGDYDKCDDTYSKLLEVMRSEYEDYMSVLADIALFYLERRDYDKAFGIYDTCLDSFAGGNGSIRQFSAISPVFDAPSFNQERIDRTLYAVKERANSDLSASDHCPLAILLFQLGDTEQAYAIAKDVEKDLESIIDESDGASDLSLINDIALIFTYVGDFDSAISVMKNEMSCIESNPYMASMSVEVKGLLAKTMIMNGNYREGLDLLRSLVSDADLSGQERLDIRKQILGSLVSMGRYEEAVVVADSILAVEDAPSERWEVQSLKVNALISLADISQSTQGEDIAALRKAIDEMYAFVEEYFPDDPEMSFMKHVYGASLFYLENDDEAMIAEADSAVKILSSSGFNPTLASSYLYAISVFYVKAGLYDIAESMIEAPGFSGNEVDTDRIFRSSLSYEIALGRGDLDEARKKYVGHCEYVTSLVKRQFVSLTSDERAGYWRMFSRQIHDAGRFAAGLDGPSDFAGAVYDLELFAKGLLLSSEQAISRMISAIGDRSLEEKYSMYRSLSRSLKTDKTLSKDVRESRLARVAELEREIIAGCRAYGDYTERLGADWRDIRAALREGETAIEFVQYDDLKKNHYLGAAVLTPALAKPVFIELGLEGDIAERIESDFDGSSLWNPIAPYITKGGKVYFSPAGYLHRLPVESCCAVDAGLYRLSSTRVLLERRGEKDLLGGECAAFGGLDYGFNPVTGGGRRSGNGYLDQLPGTLAELDCLARLWPKDGVRTFTDRHGTKDSFMSLDHGSLSLLHIGTHGYFDSALSMDTSGNTISSILNPVNAEDRSLRSCGLYFAGANDAVADTTLMVDSYRVNAEEMSMLDFSHLDLAVLSACETAAGEVTGEGVFGLQRGFKLAGAKSLLMSLWKVDDAATEKLMSEFYKNLFADPTAGKHAALEAAKTAVRSNPQWKDPPFWSAFILLDAVD